MAGRVFDLFRRAEIDAGLDLALAQAVDDGARRQIAIKRDGAGGVVIAGDRIGDAVRIGIGIQNRGHRNAQLRGFGDGDGFLVGVDHEQHVGKAAHFLDAAQRTLQLVLLAQQAQQFLLGQARLFGAVVSVSSIVRRRRIEWEMVCQLVSVPPSQRWFT